MKTNLLKLTDYVIAFKIIPDQDYIELLNEQVK